MATIIWAAQIINDCEGRTTKIAGLFTKQEDAEQVNDMYGKPADAIEMKVYDSIYEYNREYKIFLKNQALAKLTNEEKSALGLT